MTKNELDITQFFWLILIGFVVALVARRFKVPYALALVVTGVIIGASPFLPQARLEPSLLFRVFLPPLLFEATINLRLEALKRDWKPITIYTLGGTLISTFVVGAIVSVVLGIPFKVAFVFGALISATDPIAVIGIFKRLGAGKRLTLIVEAESLFNDGVAVVLFAVALEIVAGRNVSLQGSLLQFLRLMMGGIALGAGIGWLAARVHDGLDDHLVEITLTSIVAFGSYLGAEALHVSGVMAVVSAGLVIGNYGMQSSMTPGTRLAVTAFWEYAGFVVNSLIFLLIGIEATYVHWNDKWLIVLVANVAVLVGRAAIYPLSWVVNRIKGDVPSAWQHILFWGGLRGALSLALALGLSRDFPLREMWIASTAGVVMFSLLGQGITLSPLLDHLQKTETPKADPEGKGRLMSEVVAIRAALLELERAKAQEVYPTWAFTLLLRRYQERLEQAEAALRTINPGAETPSIVVTTQLRESLFLAEKSAYQEAERSGWLSAEDWQKIAQRIDLELIALSSEKRE